MHLAKIFGDHMILQRNKPICIFGYGKGIGNIEFCGEFVEFESKEDEFRVYLPPMTAGGPYDMKVTLDGKITEIHDIMIGEVYIAAGQSNIEYCLGGTYDIEYKENNNIRFFTEPTDVDINAVKSYKSSDWIICHGEDSGAFSAIGYYFAIELQKHIGVPVGVVSCSKGASRIDGWTSPESVESLDYKKMISIHHYDYDVYKFNQDSWLYKNKLINIVPFAVSGVLWYQGESNRCHEEAIHYARLLEIMIDDWRKLWNCNLPFYCVQLMPFDEDFDKGDWATIRSQQELATKQIDNIYMVTLVDTGEARIIHPLRKKKVSYALVNAVRNVQFSEDIEYSGPILESVKKFSDYIELEFSHSKGLCVNGDFLYDTYVYGVNTDPLPVNYVIEGNVLRLFWRFDIEPIKVTMGYGNIPMHNLYNGAGYLASPFSISFE